MRNEVKNGPRAAPIDPFFEAGFDKSVAVGLGVKDHMPRGLLVHRMFLERFCPATIHHLKALISCSRGFEVKLWEETIQAPPNVGRLEH